MKRYGIIGNPLGHSYSKDYFTERIIRENIRATYEIHAIENIASVKELICQLNGFNVTYPYKETIIPYLTDIDEIALQIGAVNVVHQGKGYNTDWIGFRNSLRQLIIPSDNNILLLGTGGVSKAIQYALKEMQMQYTIVSRTKSSNTILYSEVNQQIINNHSIIVNCTPLGMYPYEQELPSLPYSFLNTNHLLYDCIYNPTKTLFLLKGEQYSCRIKNGLEMLQIQANEAWKIWNNI